MKAQPMAGEESPDATTWGLIATLVLSVLANIGAGLKWVFERRDMQTKTDAARVDAAHASQVASLVDRIDDTEARLNEMTTAHRDCERNHATLAGRVGALEAQAAECFEDRKALRDELRRKLGS